MKNKLFFTITVVASSLFLQIFIVPFFSVNQIKPDLIAGAIVIATLISGVTEAMIIAFVVGLIVDSMSGFPLGTSSLVYVWGAYITAFFRKYEFWLGFNFSVIAIVGILITRSLITFISLSGSEWAFTDLFIVRVIPETIYSFAFTGIFFVFFRDKMQKYYLA